jgi:hypothetical protein
VVYGTALEKRQAQKPRGFESHPLRHALRLAGESALKKSASVIFPASCGALLEESHSGLVGATGNRVCASTVGSNPTSSAQAGNGIP